MTTSTPEDRILKLPGAENKIIRLAEIETSLKANCRVEDCLVLARESVDGNITLIVYVVPTLPFAAEGLESEMKAAMPSADMPCFTVPVAALPLTPTGEIDIAALQRLPVLDTELLQRWNAQLTAVPGVSQATVVVQEPSSEPGSVHLADLISGWKPGGLQDPELAPAVQDSAPKAQVKPRPAAYADGGPLTIPADAPKTFTEAILRTAQRYPNKGILHVRPDGDEYFQSYPALLEQAKRILAGLHAQGLKQGDRVILQCELLSDHFAAFWGCILGGITPVNVAVSASYAERNAIVNKLYNVWKLLKHPAIVASENLVQPLTGLERFFPGEKFKVLSVEQLKNNPPTENIYISQPDDLVFFQLTSGSTGVPKCIQESHRSIIAHIHGSAQFNGYTPDDVVLNWLPVDHVVPTLTVNLKDVYMGCQEIQAATNFVLAEPLHWLELMEAHKVTHSWAPNFGFKLVADRLASVEDAEWDLSSVKFLMNAGEQVTLPVVADFLRRTAPFGITPQVMQPAFGMAEVCTCMTYANDFTIETGVRRFLKSTLSGLLELSSAEDATTTPFVDLGPPVPGVEIRITDSQNQVVPEGKIGRFQIRGTVTTRGYLYNDEANKEALVGDGWFNSGDLGFIWNGRLTLTGREKEMIIVRGANFYCYEIEDVVNALPGVEPTFTGAVAVSDPATGTEGLAIFFVPQSQDIQEKIKLLERVRTAVASNLGISPSVLVPLRKSEFCKTTSGKIQRNQMKKSLAAGEYSSILKELDIAMGNHNTLPQWFYRKTWRRKSVTPQPLGAGDGALLMFADTRGLAEQAIATLQNLGQSCVRVEAGPEFAQLSSTHYRINPTNPEHYRRLLTSVRESGVRIGRILHLWAYSEPSGDWEKNGSLTRSLDEGAHSLLFAVQALNDEPESWRPSELLVVASHAQNVEPGDSLDPGRGAVLGLLKTVPQETPWLACKHLDLQAADVRQDADALLAEVQAGASDREVAWREGNRLVARLQALDFQKNQKPAPFKQGGFYVLSGGLGGVGVQVARWLLKSYHARLLILGRTPLPEHQTWHEHVARGGVVAERIQAFQELERLGEVAYEAVNIGDFSAVQAALARTQQRWQGELDGVVHMAGLYEERLLKEETPESFTRVLGPKVKGAVALHRLLKGRRDAIFISFSSIYGFFGGFSIGAYSAANAFLDALAEYQRGQGMQGQSLAWSIWDDTGMSRGFAMKQLSRSRGYYSMLHEQGINSLRAASADDCACILVGLDAGKAAIQRHLENGPHGLQELTGYVVPCNGEIPAVALSEISIADRFGTITRCRLQQLEKMPLTAAGEVDRQQLVLRLQESQAGGEPPQTEVEKALAQLWSEVLGVERVSRNDNFFDLGGHSLAAVQITFKIRQMFDVDFPLKLSLEAPVLGEQAQLLEQKLLEQADSAELERLMGEIDPAS